MMYREKVKKRVLFVVVVVMRKSFINVLLYMERDGDKLLWLYLI